MENQNLFKWKHYQPDRFWCKKSIKLGHTDTMTLKKGCHRYENEKFVQVETLSV